MSNCCNCGAPVNLGQCSCAYCGTPYMDMPKRDIFDIDRAPAQILYADNVPILAKMPSIYDVMTPNEIGRLVEKEKIEYVE